ncbi:hypothetical protein ACN2XU_20060 [Primorskyibacter sp. 2E107]
MLAAQLGNRHAAFSLTQDRKDLWFAKSRHLHQNLLRYLAEKSLRPHPLSFGEDYHMNPAIAGAQTCFADLLDPLLHGNRIDAARHLVERQTIKSDGATRRLDRARPIAGHPPSSRIQPAARQRRLACATRGSSELLPDGVRSPLSSEQLQTRARHLAVQHQIGRDSFQPTFLVLMLRQPLHLCRQKNRKLRLPIEVGGLAYRGLPTDPGNRCAFFALLDNERLLRVRNLLCLHVNPLLIPSGYLGEKLQPQIVQFAGIRSPAPPKSRLETGTHHPRRS